MTLKFYEEDYKSGSMSNIKYGIEVEDSQQYQHQSVSQVEINEELLKSILIKRF